MNAKRLAAVALAALLVVSGVGMATPGTAPTDAGADAQDENRPDDAGPGQVGPPGGLPDPVPDFVGDILDRIEQGVDGLGQAVSELASGATPGENEGQEPAQEQSNDG